MSRVRDRIPSVSRYRASPESPCLLLQLIDLLLCIVSHHCSQYEAQFLLIEWSRTQVVVQNRPRERKQTQYRLWASAYSILRISNQVSSFLPLPLRMWPHLQSMDRTWGQRLSKNVTWPGVRLFSDHELLCWNWIIQACQSLWWDFQEFYVLCVRAIIKN